MTQPYTYKEAGVDIEAGEEATRRIKQLVAQTTNAQVLSEIGNFGGLFRMMGCPEQDPVLVSSIDGVGTKMKVAIAMNCYNTVGHDIVNHCVNDILVQGARPLFFLDYLGAHKVIPDQIAELVKGISEACQVHRCCLIGGETAEMPDVYGPGEIDLVGCMIGVVAKEKILTSSQVKAGDRLIGLASTGLHTNGYTLARKVLYGEHPEKLFQPLESMEITLGEALLVPHRSYFKVLWQLLEAAQLHAMAHITGGGIPGNLCRVIPADLQACVKVGSWQCPPLFVILGKRTALPREELYRTFNMGIGMVLCVAPEVVECVLQHIRQDGIQAVEIGEIGVRPPNGKPVELVDYKV
jgi:phosphoribosylformylglycinamidine cyclo-ligase